MSYAEAAASSGPTGEPIKLPKPAELEVTTDPLGSLETVDAKKFEKERKEARELGEKAQREAQKAVNAVKDESKKLEKEWDNLKHDSNVEKVVDYVKQLIANATAFVNRTFSKETVDTVATELQNPVVVGQIAALGAGAAAGWFVYAESDRIRSDNKYVVALHAGIVTAAVLADIYVFQNLYPKYKK